MITKFTIFKKGLGAIVSVSLLLLISIISVITFQIWFNTYSSELLTDVELKINDEINDDIRIENLINSNLYILNKYKNNISFNSLQIGNVICNVNNTLNYGINTILVSNCIENISSSVVEVVLITKQKIISKKIYLNKLNNNSTNLDCSSLAGGDWILVPGNPVIGTNDFCVMKYEAKWNGSGSITNSGQGYCGSGNDYNSSTGCPLDGSIGIVSQPLLKPLSNVNQFEAIKLCENLGENYQLINNNQWMTIARNVESVSSNWVSGQVYNGFLFKGHTDNSPSYSLSISDSSDFYDQTGESAPSIQRRTFNLTNGEIIWDLSGNVWEWVSDRIVCSSYPCSNMTYDLTPNSEWVDFNNVNSFGSLSINLLLPLNNSLNSSYGIGKLYTANSASWPTGSSWNNLHAFFRGGMWDKGIQGGVYTLYLNDGPSHANPGIGFRCSYNQS